MTTNNYYKGYDISACQGSNFSWQAIVDAGQSFIIARNGVGSNQLDGCYARNVAGAKSVGLSIMCYNVIYPLSNDDPAKIAAYHYKASEGIPSAIDLEYPLPQDWKARGISAASITQWTLEYLQAYTALGGVKPLFYSYPSFFQALNLPQSFADTYGLWIASYTSAPVTAKPWTNDQWQVWQWQGGSAAKLSNGSPVDTDYCKDLSIFAVGSVQPVIAPTPPIPEISTPEPVVEQPIAIPEAPTPVVQDPNPITATATVSAPSNIITEVEGALQNNPGILTAVQNVVVKIIQKMFHIR